MGTRWSNCGVIVLMSMLSGCCGADDVRRAAVVSPAAMVPQRTAAESADMRALAIDLVAGRACEEIRGTIYPLRAGGQRKAAGEQPVIGRLWLDRCRVRRLAEGIAIEVDGGGWRWIERKAEALGATFAIDQYVRFGASFHVTAALDVAYATEEHLLHLWLTPTEPIRAAIKPTGDIEVHMSSAWSSALGWAADVLPLSSVDERAVGMVSNKVSKQAASALKFGYSLVMDLCTGERRAKLGVISQGEILGQHRATQKAEPAQDTLVRLHPNGIDLAGPFRAERDQLVVDLEVLEGPGVNARMICRDDAKRTMNAFVSDQSLPDLEPKTEIQARGDASARLKVEAECELMLLTQPLQPDEGVTFRIQVAHPAVEQEGLLDCTRSEHSSRTRE